MDEVLQDICRTCLKNKTKITSVSLFAGSNPETTYGQILKDYAKLKFIPNYEPLMPQHLCPTCCRQLTNMFNFIQQVHRCNDELLKTISKQSNNEISIECNVYIKSEDEVDPLVIGLSSVKVEVETNDTDIETNSCDLVSKSSNNHENNPTTVTNLSVNEEQPLISIGNSVCPICNKKLCRRSYLLAHMRSKHSIEDPSKLLNQDNNLQPNEMFTCKICPSKYNDNESYLKHVQDEHTTGKKMKKNKEKDAIFKCRFCDYSGKSKRSLNYHTRSKHGIEEQKFKCKFCNQIYNRNRDLLMHTKREHRDLIKTLKTEAEIKKEQGEIPTNISLTPQNESNLCNDNENDLSSSDDNMTRKISKSPPTSNHATQEIEEKDLENEDFSDEEFIRNLINFKKRVYNSDKTLVRRCNECGQIFKNQHTFYAHQRYVHVSEDKYKPCPHCEKKFKFKSTLRLHIKNVHVANNTSKEIIKKSTTSKVKEKRILCSECSFVCNTITTLRIHRHRHHTGERPYKCEFCPKSFIVPYDLKLHRYIHTGERPVKCPICSKGFQDKAHLNKHKRIHVTLPPYQCDQCGKRFTLRYNLTTHQRIHLREKNLNCNICNKVFKTEALLNLHRMNENHLEMVTS